MFASSKTIDFNKTPYTKTNKSYLAAMETEITEFNERLKELQSLDFKLGAGSTGGVAALFFLAGPGIAAIASIVAAAFLYKNNSLIRDRQRKYEKHMEQLDKLLFIYKKCALAGASVTEDKQVMKLLKTIAPYIPDTSDLMPWELSRNLSHEFIDILSQPPHRVRFVFIEEKSSSLFTSFFATPKTDDSLHAKPSLNYSSFNQTRAELILKYYGKPIDVENPKESRELKLAARLL